MVPASVALVVALCSWHRTGRQQFVMDLGCLECLCDAAIANGDKRLNIVTGWAD
jgi:hypothetical protein